VRADAVRAPRPNVPARLRRIAARVEGIGRARGDPEEALIEREDIAEALHRLAQELELQR
jgi:hypothetical protein